MVEESIATRIENRTFLFFRVDPSEPTDFKEAFDICELLNDDIPWPDEECSDFKPTVRSFFNTCEKLTHGILDMIAVGLQLEVRAAVINFGLY